MVLSSLGKFRDYIVLGGIALIFLLVLWIFFKSLLVGGSMIIIGATIFYKLFTDKIKLEKQMIPFVVASIFMLIGIGFFVGAVPASLVGLYPETSPQGTIPLYNMNVKPSVVSADVSDVLRGQFQHTYVEFCEFVPVPYEFVAGETGVIHWSTSPGNNGGKQWVGPGNNDYVTWNRVYYKLDGVEIDSSLTGIGEGGDTCTKNTSELVRLAPNLFGLTPEGINEGDGYLFTDYSIPSDLVSGSYVMELWVDLRETGVYGSAPDAEVFSFKVLGWGVEVENEADDVVPVVDEPVVVEPVVDEPVVDESVSENFNLILGVISIVLLLGVAISVGPNIIKNIGGKK